MHPALRSRHFDRQCQLMECYFPAFMASGIRCKKASFELGPEAFRGIARSHGRRWKNPPDDERRRKMGEYLQGALAY
jgi:hypothetical protein